jgi:hypothetical protein
MGVVLLAALSLEAIWRARAGADDTQQARRRALMLAAWAACWAPFLLYAAWLQWHSPLVQAWSQAWSRSVPSPLNYLLSLGFWFPLALWGAYRSVRRKDERAYGLIAWAAVSLLLLYLPVPSLSLHRSLDAAHVPWMALGSSALWSAPWRPHLRFAMGVVLCMTSFLLLAVPFTAQAVENSTIPGSTWAALQYIQAHRQSGDVVLSGRNFGLYVPVWAGVDAYDGQFAETLHMAQKDKAVVRFFRGDPSYDSATFLSANRITWIYEGPDERAASQGHDWFAAFLGCKYGEPCLGAPALSSPQWSSGSQALYEFR